jgi:3',5'-cyclic-AMP phosphodiesterase
MRIRDISAEPIHQIPYLHAGAQGRVETAQLPILHGTVEGLPQSLDAIICTADLQGTALPRESSMEVRLLGELVAEELPIVLEILGIASERTGILLTGDFYSAPQADERGASGDVRPVWDAFSQRFRWVVGVLGNHDRFGLDGTPTNDLADAPNAHCLDGTTCFVDGLTLAGISGIIGKPTKPLRRSAADYLATLDRLSRKQPDILILHSGPSVLEPALPGADELATVYRRQSYPLTIFGHVFWPVPLVECGDNQLLNVDSRVIILQPHGR